MILCEENGCRLEAGHTGDHSHCPKAAWAFMEERDQKKLEKAGYATPRGGNKGAYQNHVYRNNRVIIPFERIGTYDLNAFKDGYVVRLYPDQYFESPGVVKREVASSTPPIEIGVNAFVLYRSHSSLEQFPPPEGWNVRGLERNGKSVRRRGPGVTDTGRYVLRLPTLGRQAGLEEGPPQGIS